MQAGDCYSPILGRLLSRQREAKRLDCKLILLSFQVTSDCSSQFSTSVQAQNVPECDGEAWFNFIPSWILMSTALQLNLAQAQGMDINFGKICWDDPLLWHHPMLSDNLSRTQKWFMI